MCPKTWLLPQPHTHTDIRLQIHTTTTTHIHTPPDTHTQIHTPRHTFPRPTNSQSKTISEQNLCGNGTGFDFTVGGWSGAGSQQSQSLLLFLIDRWGGEKMMTRGFRMNWCTVKMHYRGWLNMKDVKMNIICVGLVNEHESQLELWQMWKREYLKVMLECLLRLRHYFSIGLLCECGKPVAGFSDWLL